MTRLLVVSDEISPALERAVPREGFGGVDLILSCGDLPYDYLEYLVDALNAPLLYVHGNHDHVLEADGRIIATPQGGTSVEGRVVQARGVRVAGLGGSPRYQERRENQFTEREMRRRVRRLDLKLRWARLRRAEPLDVLLTHAPPRGIHDHQDPVHRGFLAFIPLIERHRPRYLIHGHSYPRPRLPARTRCGGTEVIHVRGHQLLEVPDV